MERERVVFVRCMLSRGTTSAERIFRIDAPGGGDLYGSASMRFCYNSDRVPLKPTEATTNEEVNGLVVGVQLRTSVNGIIRAQMPNGDIYEFSEALAEPSVQKQPV